MNIQQLEYIEAVAKFKHFGKAAKSCFVTQPTLSMMVKKIEQELGVELFDRRKTPIELTAMGVLIHSQARVVLTEIRKIKAIIQEQRESISGQFKLGIIPTLAPYLLPLFIEEFTEKFPMLSLQIIESTTANIVSELRENNMDAAILATPLNEDDMIERPIFTERFFLYSDLQSKKNYIAPQDINIDRLILLEEGHCLRSQVYNLCEMKEKNKGSLQYKTGSIETLINLVDRNQGSTIVPELVVEQLSEKRKNKVKSFHPPQPAREISIITHKSFMKNRIVDALEKEIVSSLPESLNHINDTKIIDI